MMTLTKNMSVENIGSRYNKVNYLKKKNLYIEVKSIYIHICICLLRFICVDGDVAVNMPNNNNNNNKIFTKSINKSC